jgi:hypothetical protein
MNGKNYIMKRIVTIFTVLAIAILFSSCMKFEDGPCISFRSKDSRWQGEWLLKYWTVDGVDSLQYWNDFFRGECDFKFYPCENDYPYHCNYDIHWGSTDSIFYNFSGYDLGFNDVYFVSAGIAEDPASAAFPLWFMRYPMPRNNLVEWTVTRLKYDEMWIEMDVNNKHYELHLENIKKF